MIATGRDFKEDGPKSASVMYCTIDNLQTTNSYFLQSTVSTPGRRDSFGVGPRLFTTRSRVLAQYNLVRDCHLEQLLSILG